MIERTFERTKVAKSGYRPGMAVSQISVGLMVEVFGEAIGKHARAARQPIDPERAKRARAFNETCSRQDRSAT
jgi:hypothetical protein